MEQNLNEILRLRREKLANLQEAGKDPFVITKFDQTHHSVEIKENYDELEGKTVSIAGRMMFKRVMGKASFERRRTTFPKTSLNLMPSSTTCMRRSPNLKA